MAKRRRNNYASETKTIEIPPAHYEPHITGEIIAALSCGEMELEGLLPWSSNYTFLALVGETPLQFLAVYKPCRGERPLWDFPNGTLCKREVAAYQVCDALGWEFVPPTVLRDGPHGLGSVQLFIDCDQNEHYFTLKDTHAEEFMRMAVFDALLNNTDRKGGHCLADRHGKIWAIDHGVTFHCEPKLRTVIWDYAGLRIPADMLAALRQFQARMMNGDAIATTLDDLLNPDEIEALLGRLDELIETGAFPEPGAEWYNVPWPPV
ncbi:MAG: SCO1664 family protein [Chloroflexota bacterium]